VLKSRRVVPGRLLDAGFTFSYPTWEQAARNWLLDSAPYDFRIGHTIFIAIPELLQFALPESATV
jgi:hexokinase